MPATLEALGVIVVAVLPGALYTWALEREAGNWGIGFSDRALRFVGASAIFHIVFLYPTYRFWIAYIHRPTIASDGTLSFQNLFLENAVPWWIWLLLPAYIVVPILSGTIAGLSVHNRPRLARIMVGRDPAPRAWDHLFSPRPVGMLRAQLSDDRWVGGFFADQSYASGYPEAPQDIYIEKVYTMGEDGSFGDPADPPESRYSDHGALIRWEHIKILEFFHLPGGTDGQTNG